MTTDVARLSTGLLEQEARALLTRLDQVKPFALNETTVLAAALPFAAQSAIERALHQARVSLRRQVNDYLGWIRGPGRAAPAADKQRRFVIIRLRFNAVLSQLDLFAEVITQRSEHATGVWLSGLDALAYDALRISPTVPDPPPIVCALIRGPGASIRRARTRLPGGDANPVAIIRVPRERMVGHGIGSSLVHEVGHQAAALLGLVESVRPVLTARAAAGGADAVAWKSWASTVSEIMADVWSVGTLGISSSLGLLAVVSLPRFFVFRPPGTDPHPSPYVRVLVSARIGEALYPHPQWRALRNVWKSYYPAAGASAEARAGIAAMERTMPAFVHTVLDHRPPSLQGRPIKSLFPLQQRQPAQLMELFRQWNGDIGVMARQPPSLVFAVVGQARAVERLTPERESQLLSTLLRVWALRSSLNGIEHIHQPPRTVVRAS
jgi:hypothetical protein